MGKLKYVNALIGTENEPRFSNGNIFPVTATPWGMSGWCIQTKDDGGWFFNPRHRIIDGIRLTHQPSPWIGDYGDVLFNFTFKEDELIKQKYSSFRPNECEIQPDYIRVYSIRYRTNIELVPCERGGIFKIKNNSLWASVFILKTHGVMQYKQIDDNSLELIVETKYCWGQKSILEYLYIDCTSRIKSVKLIDKALQIEVEDKEYELKVSTSFISNFQAKQNYFAELSCLTFEQIHEKAIKLWEKVLSLIDVVDDGSEKINIFYSSLYRTFLYPRKFYEITKDGKIVHYNPDVEKVCDGVFYTDNGFWDTYRTVYPLYSIICPDVLKDMIQGFVNFYIETGYLPKWISPGECGLMPGTLIEAVIADAGIKGVIDGDLLKKAYEGMIKNATIDSHNGYQGRKMVDTYSAMGYLPFDKIKESVNNTLDCAYGDFCISQVAKILDDEKEQAFFNRSKNYKNLFNKEYGFIMGKDSNGEFEKDFSSVRWGGVNCEASYWQTSLSVYHDFEGLAELHGGKKKFLEKLDELFNTSPIFEVGAYNAEIHEMSEMAAIDFGQCAISNQPSFHIPWLYSLFGDKEKTSFYIEKLVKEVFRNTIDGFPGDEDNGTMGAWFVFSCLGFYPICPGKAEYVLSKPLVDARISIGKDKWYQVKKDDQSKETIISHFDLISM